MGEITAGGRIGGSESTFKVAMPLSYPKVQEPEGPGPLAPPSPSPTRSRSDHPGRHGHGGSAEHWHNLKWVFKLHCEKSKYAQAVTHSKSFNLKLVDSEFKFVRS